MHNNSNWAAVSTAASAWDKINKYCGKIHERPSHSPNYVTA